MLFGAIDVGTNSIHLVVIAVDDEFGTSRIIYKDREMVRLGADDAMSSGRLSERAMDRGAVAIRRFVRDAEFRGASRIRAIATSAVREAENGAAFAARVEREAGVTLEVLDAHEEARLIHLGVAAGYPIYDRLACIIDVGGGSTEVIVGNGERPYLLESVKLGSLRLYDRFLRGYRDQLAASGVLDAYVAELLAPIAERVAAYPLDVAIATSGTALGMAAVDMAQRGVRRAVNGYVLERDRLAALQRTLLRMRENERRRVPGMNPRRSDIIVAGNAVLLGLLDALRWESLVVSDRALREGIVVELAAADRRGAGSMRARRLHAIEALAQHYQHLGVHERRVARLALRLFEAVADLHGLPPVDAVILHAAAIVHGIGRFVAESGRHKHTAYLVRATPLDGWPDEWRHLVAAVARYHRKAMPKPGHLEWDAFAPADRRRIEVLAAILRIADELDAGHLGDVADVTVRREPGRIVLVAQAEGEVPGELPATMDRSDLFERVFGVRIRVEAVAADGART